jgi:class 3 adenylate cyclase
MGKHSFGEGRESLADALRRIVLMSPEEATALRRAGYLARIESRQEQRVPSDPVLALRTYPYRVSADVEKNAQRLVQLAEGRRIGLTHQLLDQVYSRLWLKRQVERWMQESRQRLRVREESSRWWPYLSPSVVSPSLGNSIIISGL